ncbi:MAG: hypothetical protein J5874_03130 [Oscillospiraceae bacterium]|nr:hypothetical protein [Oscillospiraceae bacterium]
MKRRILAIVGSLIMIIATVLTLAACADTNKKPDVTTKAGENGEGTVDARKTKVPEGLKFDDEEITFAISETDSDGFHLRSIESDDPDTTNKVDRVIFERNRTIEERLGVTLTVEWYGTGNIRSSEVNTSLANQDSDYDVICGRQYDDVVMCLEGNLADLTQLYDGTEKIDYIDFNAPYWSTYYIEAMRCGDSIYWLTGDLCLRYTCSYYCTFVNAYIYEKYLEAEFGSIYSIVKEGKWDYDTLNQMTLKSFENLDGDDAVTEDDQCGGVFPVWDNTNGLALAAGVNWSTRNDDGTMEFEFTNANDRLLTWMSTFRSVLNNGAVRSTGGNYVSAMTSLASDLAGFVLGRLNQAELYLGDMEHDYYILPCPKLTKEQAQYRSSVHDGVQLYGINAYSTHIGAVAATLELMAAGSYWDVRPIYYDEALKYMYSRDQGAADMIDLMGEVVYSDFGYIFQFTKYFPCGSFLRNNATVAKPSSVLAKSQDAWVKGMDEVQQDILELQGL